ncbi:cyclic nucleotide-binding domain-containing protein [Flavobacterium sp. Sd200]|uniref:Crp/Fnr family transcriptional regulator n=1 Tax=Flavobacterium sp. Sd200 TaxID=2692211 RepID=UPI00136C849A|nr:Crp/Fnr family transcriptional regulator [Flavobacterium sp. Sd200]MXN90617.1 cyclic nucleotide-binding domain-containing protein [Flavobacterium sp. Sd200]
MFDVFIEYLQSKLTITDAEVEMVKQICRLKKLRKKQYLLQEGDVWRYNAFVQKGLLRTYRVDNKGQEHVIQFSAENWWSGDRYSYLTETPARYNIEAIEDCDIVLITKVDYENLLEAIPALNTFVRHLVERSFIASQNRINADISFTAEEKYNDFVTTHPALLNRIPQHMIASYLGLTPETLSRVRSKR